MATQGYRNLSIGSNSAQAISQKFLPRTYKGFSSVSTETNNGALYDLALIKQDLINHFHIRKGEKLENPEFGTIIWDMLFEPMTEQVKELIVNDVSTIVNSDPRIKNISTIVTQVEQGIQIELTLLYVPYNIQESMQFAFDSKNMLV
jgi:phage baseplate assembly protein W